ncbi:hypothetical protein PF001_g19873 [Phytophthora fragariae]|uniref:Uncharacterized protein n=1 Tax=Phytophthora fragariae TaxID=53985 RepID=A0A6A4CE55_9STRA|nr:hypothetical protein PF001_g19873 [Phytophthora fragariae]
MHAVPIAADSSTAGEFDQQWEFGFNSDINAASASEASSDSDDSDAGYVSSVYGDREPSSDSKSEDSGVINEAFGRNTSPVFVGANVDEARNDDDSGLSSSMSSAGGSGDSESEEITIAMEVGVLDMLTVVVPEHVDPHGINFVTELIMGRCRTVGIEYSTVSWARFWVYFRKTWINTFSVDVWNVFGMDLNIVSRTNNPLERFNRELNAAIAAPHPSIPAFISTIDTLSRRYVQLLNDISNRRAIAPVHGAINLPDAVDLNPRVIAARRRSTTANQRGGRE